MNKNKQMFKIMQIQVFLQKEYMNKLFKFNYL